MQIAEPRLSILMPVWNGLPYLGEALRSVFEQRFGEWELIVADDGSTDGSRATLAEIDDARVRVVEQPANLGIFGNLNWLCGQARAPVCQILCQDDYLADPGALGRLIAHWETMPSNVGFARVNWLPEATDCSMRRFSHEAIPAIVPPEQADLFFFLFGCVPGNLSNVSFRTALIEQAGWFDQSLPYAGDYEFWSRAARIAPFALIADAITFVRAHEGQASVHLNKQGELVAQLGRVTDDLYDRLESQLSPQLLRLHATLNLDGLQRRTAVRELLRGRGREYLRQVDRSARDRRTLLPLPLCWLSFALSGGGMHGRTLPARALMREARRRASSTRQRM